MNREKLVAKTFVELTETLVDTFDAVDMMHTLTDRVVELLGADAAGMILVDQRGDLQVVATTSHEAQVVELLALQNDEGPCLDCYNSGEPVVNLDAAEARRRWPRFTESTFDAGYQSSHALPLRLNRRTIGVVNLFCKERASLSLEDLALGQALADVATICLLQERAVRQKELLAEQLQTALNTRILIEQAKGSLAEREQVSVDAAFDLMRSYGRRHQQPLRKVAAGVIDGSIVSSRLVSR